MNVATKQQTQKPEDQPATKASARERKLYELQQRAMSADQIKNLVRRAQEESNLTEREAFVILALSVQTGGATKREVGIELNKNEWQVYNIRRDAVRKLAPLMGLDDPEDAFAPLGLSRGHRLPERHTQYWPKKEVVAQEDPGEEDVEDEEDMEIEDDEEEDGV